MNPILYSNFALFMALISSAVSEDFCEAFFRNNGEISYILKTDTRVSGVVTYNLIINGSYWSTTVDVNIKTAFTPLTTDSKGCPVFSGQYYAAVWMDSTKKCAILFSEKLWPKVDTVCNNVGDANNLANYQKSDGLTVKGVDRPSRIVFLQDRHDATTTILVFVVQKSLGETLSFEAFDVTKDQKILTAKNKTFGLDLDSLKSFKPNLHLISIVYQWTEFDGYYHFLFFKEKWIIKWCLTSVKALDIELCQNKPTVLIDCTKKATTTTTKAPIETSEPTEEPPPYGTIVVIVVIILVIIVLIGVVVYLCCYSKSKTDLKTNNNSEVSQKSRVSSTEKQTTTLVGSTFSTNFGPKK